MGSGTISGSIQPRSGSEQLVCAYRFQPGQPAKFQQSRQRHHQPPGRAQTYILAGLVPGTRYSATLLSRDAAGNFSPLSNIISFTTGVDTVRPAAITTLTSGNITRTSARLSFVAPADLPSNRAATTYSIEYSNNPASPSGWRSAKDAPIPAAPGTAQGFTLEDLVPGLNYAVRIYSRDAASNLSQSSNVAYFTTSFWNNGGAR